MGNCESDNNKKRNIRLHSQMQKKKISNTGERVENIENIKPNDDLLRASNIIAPHHYDDQKPEETKVINEIEPPTTNIPNNVNEVQEKIAILLMYNYQNYNMEFLKQSTLNDLLININLQDDSNFIFYDGEGNEISTEDKTKTFAEIFENRDEAVIKIEGCKKLNLKDPLNYKGRYIGAPIFDDTNYKLQSIYVYDILNKNGKKCNLEFIDNYAEIKKFNKFSSICNGNNKMFISGGEYEDENNVTKLNDFYEIDLVALLNNQSNCTKALPKLKEFRSMHSMIYIPNYIVIVGGSNLNTVEIYDIDQNTILIDSELNEERSECSLCYIGNEYLYAIFGFKIGETYVKSIERCNLSKKVRKWEIVPLINEDAIDPQAFYCSYKLSEDTILLLQEGDNDTNALNYKLTIKEDGQCQISKCDELHGILNGILLEKQFIKNDDGTGFIFPYAEEGDELNVFSLETNDRRNFTCNPHVICVQEA